MPFSTEGSSSEGEMKDYDVQTEKGSEEVLQNFKWATSETADGILANYGLVPWRTDLSVG